MKVDGSGRVWALRPDSIGIAEAADRRARAKAEDQDQDQGAALGESLEGSDFAYVVDGVAMVPVKGLLMNRMSWFFWSYEEIRRDIGLALADDNVERIVLDIDSPGGLVAGCADLAAFIRDARDQKPIAAWCGGVCASAAFMIGGSASELHLGSGAIVGSVGAVIEYLDLEPYFEKLGARMIRVVAEQSPNKRLDPESDEGKAEMQALVDAGCEEFIEALAQGRNVSTAVVRDRFGQGLVFKVDEAIERGMADGAKTFDEILAELAGRESETGAAPAAANEENPMDLASIDLAGLREHRSDLVEAIEAAARSAAETAQKDAVDAATTAERDRHAAIDEVAVAGHEDLVAAAKKDGTTAEQLAVQILKADKAEGKDHLSARQDADKDVDVPSAPPSSAVAVDENAPIEDQAKAEWAKNTKLHSEFRSEAAYVAFRTAEAKGSAKILRAS